MGLLLYYGGYGLVLLGLVICLLASWNVNSTFRRYNKIHSSRGLTGAQAARQILDGNGLYQVGIEHVSGELTDHYDPRTNVIRLSDATYDSTSVASIGVAAHECGHAVQYAQQYVPMKIRSAIIPVTQLGSKLWYLVFILGLILSASSGLGDLGYVLQNLGIMLFSLIVLFQLITLPVEFNASRRAMNTLESRLILTNEEAKGARRVLAAAALTYVASLLNSILQLLRLLAIRGNRRR